MRLFPLFLSLQYQCMNYRIQRWINLPYLVVIEPFVPSPHLFPAPFNTSFIHRHLYSFIYINPVFSALMPVIYSVCVRILKFATKNPQKICVISIYFSWFLKIQHNSALHKIACTGFLSVIKYKATWRLPCWGVRTSESGVRGDIKTPPIIMVGGQWIYWISSLYQIIVLNLQPPALSGGFLFELKGETNG